MAIIPENKDGSAPKMTAALTRDPVCLVLRRAREEAGYDVPDIAQLLRIQRPYLEAIEDGRYGDLPGTVYAIGFVRTYSDFLNLDTNDMVRRFKEEASELSKRTDYVFPVAPTEARVPGVGLLVVGVLLAALAYGAWHVTSDGGDGLADRVAEIPDRFAELASRGGEAPQPNAVPPAASPDRVAETATTSPTDDPLSATPAPAAVPNFDALAALAESRRQTEAPTTEIPTTETEPAYVASEDVAPEPQPAPAETVIPVVIAEPTPPAAEPAPQAPAPIETAQNVETLRRVPPAVPGAASEQSFDVAVATPEVPSSNGQPKAATEDQPSDSTISAPTNILPNRQPTVATAPPPPPPAAEPGQARRSGLGSLNSRILIRATEMSWVQITDDLGNLVMTRVLESGETYRVPNTDGLTLASGNAGGLEVLVDGVVQPPLGLRGTVVRNVALDPENFGSN